MNMAFFFSIFFAFCICYSAYMFLSIFLQIQEQKKLFVFKNSDTKTDILYNIFAWLRKRSHIKTPGYFITKFTNPQRLHSLLTTSGLIDHVKPINLLYFEHILILTVSWIIFGLILIFGNFLTFFMWEIGIIFTIIKLPEILLQFITYRRKLNVEKHLPDFVDMLATLLASGLHLEKAFEVVTRHTQGVLQTECKRVLTKFRMGFAFQNGLQECKTRIISDDVHGFITAIEQAKKLGVSLSKTLELQSGLMRGKKRQRIEELTRTAAVKIAIPLVFFIFPALLIIYLAPGLIRLSQL